jgi:hypothetical protein
MRGVLERLGLGELGLGELGLEKLREMKRVEL